LVVIINFSQRKAIQYR